MTVYVLFLAFVFLWAALCYSRKTDKRKNEILFLNVVWIAMFLLCALRASSVGRDLPGYELAYNQSDLFDWGDFDYVYFENGYVFLMKICSKLLHLPFQGYLAVVSAIIMVPIYIYIRKYSKNPFISTLVYVCYMFFEFNMTGIRQALAASVVLIAYMVYISAKRFPRVWFILIVLVAAQLHNAAWICLAFPILSYVKNMRLYTTFIAVCSFALLGLRGTIMSYIKEFFEKESMDADAGVYFGMNFVFTVGLVMLFLFSYAKLARTDSGSGIDGERAAEMCHDHVHIKLFMLSIPAIILFGADTAARSYMMFSQVMIVQLSNALYCWNPRDRKLLQLIFVLFLAVFFFTNTLIPNNFDIVPYKFFWE